MAMDNSRSIAMLLPSTKGMSVCSTALLYFLVNTHDEFLGIYRSATNQDRSVFISYDFILLFVAFDPVVFCYQHLKSPNCTKGRCRFRLFPGLLVMNGLD